MACLRENGSSELPYTVHFIIDVNIIKASAEAYFYHFFIWMLSECHLGSLSNTLCKMPFTLVSLWNVPLTNSSSKHECFTTVEFQ